MSSRRDAFTLVELLVVIALMMVLASLSVMFVPHIAEQQRAARGGTLLQQWLITAQQMALRDQAPRGLRIYIFPDVDGKLYGYEAQYIMQPDDFSGGVLKTLAASSPATATITGVDVSNGSTDPTLWAVQENDYLEVFGTGLVRRIRSITESPPGQFRLDFEPGTSFDYDVDTNEYRIIRQPRVASDEALKMPEDIVIDLKTNGDYGNPISFNLITDPNDTTKKIPDSVDIVFGPAGNVIGRQSGLSSVILWVREATIQELDEGEPTLITIYSRTGAIAAHPVNLVGFGPPGSGWDPYRFTRDGRSSGG